MPRRTVPLTSGSWFHIYNRGHNRDRIFFEMENYSHFLQRLRDLVVGEYARLAAYVLMPNHYHLLLEPLTDDFSHAMQRFGIAYVKAINKRFNRTGALFQGPFQAKLVDDDLYFAHLSRYLHLNPVRAGLAAKPEQWAFSSYPDEVDPVF